MENSTVLTSNQVSEKKSVLKVENLNAAYGKKSILKNINLEFFEKSFNCIIGENGSGKSTLLNILCGIENPSLSILDGKVFLNSKDIKSYKKNEIAKNISFLPQSEHYSWNHLVEDVVLMGRFPYSKGFFGYTKEDKIYGEKALEEVGILHLKDRYIFELSGGEYQQVLIARSLCQNAKILVLDEPFTHLDISKEHKLLRLLKKLVEEKNLCVIIIIHDINHAALFSENMVILKEGEILAQGDVKSVFTKPNLDLAFDNVFHVIYRPEINALQAFPG